MRCSAGEEGKGQGKGNRRVPSLTPSLSRPPSPLLRVLHTPLHCLCNAVEGTVLNLIELCCWVTEYPAAQCCVDSFCLYTSHIPYHCLSSSQIPSILSSPLSSYQAMSLNEAPQLHDSSLPNLSPFLPNPPPCPLFLHPFRTSTSPSFFSTAIFLTIWFILPSLSLSLLLLESDPRTLSAAWLTICFIEFVISVHIKAPCTALHCTAAYCQYIRVLSLSLSLFYHILHLPSATYSSFLFSSFYFCVTSLFTQYDAQCCMNLLDDI